jgi:hypothetical protein
MTPDNWRILKRKGSSPRGIPMGKLEKWDLTYLLVSKKESKRRASPVNLERWHEGPLLRRKLHLLIFNPR